MFGQWGMPQQRNFSMRGNLPSFQQLGGVPGMQQMQAQNPQPQGQQLQQMFPQFMSQQNGPQYGRSPPTWQNNWAMDSNGMGVPYTPPPPAAPQQPGGLPGGQPLSSPLDYWWYWGGDGGPSGVGQPGPGTGVAAGNDGNSSDGN